MLVLTGGIAATLTYGTWRIGHIDRIARQAPSKTFSIVQGNIDQNRKWDETFKMATTRKHIDLSLSLNGKAPDLLIWPETAIPFYFFHDRPMTRMIQNAVRQSRAGFLIGSPSFIRHTEGVTFRNSAYLIRPDGSVEGKYDKAHLVPFGEYVPCKKFLPFLGKMVAQVGDFEPGPQGRTLEWQGYQLGIQICFEIIFPHLSRLSAGHQAALLLNLTNDAWFGTSSGPYQHFAITVFRAVENKKALVRAANTGISGFIDPVGRIRSTTPLNQTATQTARLPLMPLTTVYTAVGDLFVHLCLMAAFLSGMKAFYIKTYLSK
jgi:apolipoprotein N-acyltransferase